MTTMPNVTDLSPTMHCPLKYITGAEAAFNGVIGSSLFTADSDGRKLVAYGELLVKATSGDDTGRYGPYKKDASDGRQSPAAGSVAIAGAAYDATLYDVPFAGLFANCLFDKSELTLNGLSLHGTSLTALLALFPTCTFMD